LKNKKRHPLSLFYGERPAYEIERVFPNLTESGRSSACLPACLKISDFIEKVKLFLMLPEDFFIVISPLLIVV